MIETHLRSAAQTAIAHGAVSGVSVNFTSAQASNSKRSSKFLIKNNFSYWHNHCVTAMAKTLTGNEAMKSVLLTSVAAATLMTVACVGSARAGYFNSSDWSASASYGSASVTASFDDVVLSYSYDPGFCGGCSAPTWSFSTVAPQTGSLSFQWNQSANYAYFQTSGSLRVDDPIDGLITLNTDNGVFKANGNTTLNVTAGDTITFIASASNDDYQSFVGGTVELSSFAGAIPEPASMLVLGAGLLGLGVFRRRA